jgi:hypothetical protein
MAIRAQRTHAPLQATLRSLLAAWGPTAAAVLLPLVLYLITATRTVQGGDTGEFAVVGARGGVAHPPGYPLYTALARLLCLLPLPALSSSLSLPAFRVAALSALLGALCAGVLERALRRATGSRLAALAAALSLALSPLMWRLSGVPEVFSGNALAAAATLLFCLRLQQAAPARAARAAAALGVVLGLGAANHHTIVLCAPIVIQALCACALRPGWPRARAAGALCAGAALGLLSYLYLPLAAALAGPDLFSWGDLGTPAGVLRHVARAQYGTFQLSLGGSAAPLTQVKRYLAALPREFLYVHAALGVLGFAAALRRARGPGLALLATFLLCGVLFPSLINLPLDGTGPATAARFHLLPNLWFAVALAYALAEAGRRLPRPAALALALAPLAASAALNLQQVNWRADPTVERFLRSALLGAAPRAVILGRGDLYGFGYRYVRDALGVRRDVRYLDVNLLRLRWYYDRARREVPELQLPFDPETTYVRLLSEQLAARAPTYVTADLAPLLQGLPFYPEGMLARIAPPGTRPPPPAALEPGVRGAAERMLPLPAAPIDIWSAQIREVAALQLQLLARAYDRGGDRARGDACRALGDRIVGGGR